MTTRVGTTERRPYHHGDLRHVLVESALHMLAEEQQWEFTLRELARRAGVSHAAPYKHFLDKQELLCEVAARGFVMLRQLTEAAVMKNTAEPRVQLRSAGEAYVLFAVANPALFRLMFGPSLASGRRTESLKAAAAASREVMVNAVERCRSAGLLGDGDPQMQALASHSVVHGLAMLLIDQRIAGVRDPMKVVSGVLSAHFSRYGGDVPKASRKKSAK